VLLSRLRIRSKLALLLIAPLLGMVALTVPVIFSRADVADRAARLDRSVQLANQVGSLVQDLQQERLLSIGVSLRQVEPNRLIMQSAAVTDRIADLRAAAAPLPAEVGAALDTLPPLAAVRAEVLAGTAETPKVLTAFGNAVTTLINSLGLRTTADTATAAGKQVMALDATLRYDEGISNVALQILLISGLQFRAAQTGEPVDQQAIQRLGLGMATTMVSLLADNERFQVYATPEQRGLHNLVQQGANARVSTNDFMARFATEPATALQDITLPELFPVVESMITLGRFVEKRIAGDILAEVSGRQQRALTEAYIAGGICVLVLLIVLLLSIAIARAVARPLTRLTRSADRVAQAAEAELTKIADGELDHPGAIPLDALDIRADDEIGELARAFGRVQGTAARLVERQVASRRNVAQMFGHVGRRTQNLVGRQLALIDRLERQETDPGRLQHLYHLDHVSSRLRRSASSLVVLSGSAGADNHVAPLPLADVVRLALGEIEDYTRVDVRVPGDIAMAPSVIGDIVLALAELMENATTFSPPHTRVTVTAVVTDPGVRLLVVDRGLGMTPERLAEENARLARRERLDLVPTEVLGLFVVGRLARRHGLRVKLTTTPGGGVTAEVEVPERLLAVDAADPRVVAVARARVASPAGAWSDEGAPAEPSAAEPVGLESSANVESTANPSPPPVPAGVRGADDAADEAARHGEQPAAHRAGAHTGAAEAASAHRAAEHESQADRAAAEAAAQRAAVAAKAAWARSWRAPHETAAAGGTAPAEAAAQAAPATATGGQPRELPEWPIRRRVPGATAGVTPPVPPAVPPAPNAQSPAAQPARAWLEPAQPEAPRPAPRTVDEAPTAPVRPPAVPPLVPAKVRRDDADTMSPDAPATDAEPPPVIEFETAPPTHAPGRNEFSDPAFDRASRMLRAGQPWNAFAPQPRSAPDRERTGTNGRGSGHPAAEPENRADPEERAGDRLKQRVPGAQLPPRGTVRRSAPPPGPPDPAEARALVEQFEAGVKFAERQVRAADPVPTSPAPAAATPAPTAAPAGAPSGSSLRRRRPGVALDGTATATESPASGQRLDADEARELVQQFESGVARAIQQIGATPTKRNLHDE
jgi:signal transduction histidine kinase